jgi:hypothetical protein
MKSRQDSWSQRLREFCDTCGQNGLDAGPHERHLNLKQIQIRQIKSSPFFHPQLSELVHKGLDHA